MRLCGAAYTCNIAHISYVHILFAYVVCIFYLLFGVLATLVFFPYSICELEFVHILSPGLLLYVCIYYISSRRLVTYGWTQVFCCRKWLAIVVRSLRHYLWPSMPWKDLTPSSWTSNLRCRKHVRINSALKTWGTIIEVQHVPTPKSGNLAVSWSLRTLRWAQFPARIGKPSSPGVRNFGRRDLLNATKA